MHTEKPTRILSVLLAATASVTALGDGSSIDKVYHPFVEQLEWELEWRLALENENPLTAEKRRQSHRFGLGKGISEYVFVELYLIGKGSADEDMTLEAYEVEVLWQLTEQGEYSLDYGLLFELERVRGEDIWEYSTGLLLEREFGRFSATANINLIYEWGDDIKDELETELAMQARHRLSPRLEPALELYLGEETSGLGPVLTGRERLGTNKALRWEAGIIFGLDSDSGDYTVRAVLEYEF